MNNFWEKFKKRCTKKVKKGILRNKRKSIISLMQLSEQYPSKLQIKEQASACTLKENEVPMNRWLFSLKKSDDPNRKQYEIIKSSADPNRILWAHINSRSSVPRKRKPCTSPIHRSGGLEN
jgi:hypothetical protein